MLTRIDHVMVCVHDLDQAIETYRGLGFRIYPGGAHPGRGTHNAIAFFEDNYLELLAVRDRDEVVKDGNRALLDFLERGEGLRYFILASDDLEADVVALRGRGLDLTDVREGSRNTDLGTVLRWRYAHLGPRNPLPFFLIQHLTPIDERRAQVPSRDHPNGAMAVTGVTVTGNRLEFEAILGFPPERLGITVALSGPAGIRFRSDKSAAIPPKEAHAVALAFGP